VSQLIAGAIGRRQVDITILRIIGAIHSFTDMSPIIIHMCITGGQ
jgi:hypothetical protein